VPERVFYDRDAGAGEQLALCKAPLAGARGTGALRSLARARLV
jgi:hypothetical protein